MRKVSASHVRRLLPELPGGGPAYQRLATGLRALILDGRLPLGTRLPAERELARALGISRTTTSAAYALLRREGYLTSRRGAGSFASFPFEPEPSQAGLPWLGEAEEGVIDLTVAAPTALAETFLEAAAVALEQLPLHLRGDGYRVLGLPELREAVAEHYRRRGLPTTVEQVMITSGAQGALSVGGLSKSAWGGLRIGWVRAAPALIQRLGAARPSVDIANPLLEQLVALCLLADLDTILAERRRRLATRVEALAEALADELPEWTFRLPDGGLCLWVGLDRSSTSLVGPAAAAGVRIVPGPRFGIDGTLERFLRIPFVLPPATLREAVSRLAAAAGDVPRFAERAGEVSYVV